MRFVIVAFLLLAAASAFAIHQLGGERVLRTHIGPSDPMNDRSQCEPPRLWVNERTGHMFVCIDKAQWGRLVIAPL